MNTGCRNHRDREALRIKVESWKVACPTCGAPVGRICTTLPPRLVQGCQRSHATRIKAAQENRGR